jgi:glycosyltransferase involved in cell wall biosynthesis
MENIRIAHVIPSLAKGGAERLALDICNALTQVPGVEVKLVVLSDINHFSALSKEIDIKVIQAKYTPSITGKDLDETASLCDFFETYKPHIIHTHLFEAESICRATQYFNAAYVTHCHFNTFEYKKPTLQSFTNKLAFIRYIDRKLIPSFAKKAKANLYLAVSNNTRKYFIDNLPRWLSKNVLLLHNAINYNLFAKAGNPLPPADEIILVSIGSLKTYKNQRYLIYVLQTLLQKRYSAKLYVLGDGPERENILTLADKLNCSNNLILTGNIDAVEDYLDKSHIYVHSSTIESFGLVMVEAMASGLPVIALDGLGNRDVNVEGKTGYLLPADASPEAFADRIISIASNPELYKEMSAYARNFAKGFGIEAYTQRLVAEYKKLL